MFLPSDIQSIPKEITSRTSTRTILVGILEHADFRLRTWLQLVHVFGRITQGTLEMTKLQEQLANPIPVEETIPKKELMSLLECPVCLDHFKPPLQVYKFVLPSIDPLSTFLQIWQCPEGHVICWSCKIRPELKGCPQCRVVKYRNFSRNRILEELSRKLFTE